LSNVEKKILTTSADHTIDLSENGKKQATECGKAIKKYLNELPRPENLVRNVKIWTSPYKRARETCTRIMVECKNSITHFGEHIFLAEQQFGLFEGIPQDEIQSKFPVEYNYYSKCVLHGGRFWGQMPLGESRFDVCKRINDFFHEIRVDAQNEGIEDVIIVTHGVTFRCFVMMWFGFTPEYLEEMQNPNNCSVCLLSDKAKYIFQGFSIHDTKSTFLRQRRFIEQRN